MNRGTRPLPPIRRRTSRHDPSGRLLSQTITENEVLLRHLFARWQLDTAVTCQENPDAIRRSVRWSWRTGLMDSIFDWAIIGIHECSMERILTDTRRLNYFRRERLQKKSNL